MNGYTYRCSACCVSWPHSTRYQPCPACGSSTMLIHAIDPREVLTEDEAHGLLVEKGVLPRPGIMAPQPQLVGTGEKKFDLRKETKKLYDDLERWVKEAPPWAP